MFVMIDSAFVYYYCVSLMLEKVMSLRELRIDGYEIIIIAIMTNPLDEIRVGYGIVHIPSHQADLEIRRRYSFKSTILHGYAGGISWEAAQSLPSWKIHKSRQIGAK